ncbi:acetyl-CoA carboxylase biotin carboxylase subunit [Spiractinospora alimapuensis]|uniref:acetyl-CoA carboxylase biotin carboxylase subunit n=1 Tax=Spiractinospora alimapuensis TaxID=2820884 RepID=UPI001F1F9C8A|nr:acetyl-CoA carboxylase biotin carboxylase subunit [Spiractinospora alimapuensis]QVQ50196.1 acetyl-CoA carboxylase biotin carboxylase subunit [Spiractinospora alimapuensis]
MSGLRRVLVANRGEIALRILRACHEAGIEAVAAHSKADTDARWVRLADAAHHIGGSPAAKSYLNIEAVLEAALASGADAVHPGYGFLAENAEFAAAVRERGLVFVGPPAEVIAQMGDKSEARRTAVAAGVPVVPGSGPVADVAAAAQEAEAIGYPILVKAAAGGGGRGIRPVAGPEELSEVFPTAQAEASAAFGDGTLYLERAIEGARHIEVQVMGDTHGNVVHLFERDCSVQRRRQKLIEEAPAPGLGATVRADLASAAVRLAKHVNYVGAGTVEFLVEPDGSFYFMEMNTRIQVEHPITECVTGVDLVAEQLRVAAGEVLSFAQVDVELTGAAIEVRINAEDPTNDFAPTPGNLGTFTVPGGPGVRVDTGFAAGDTVSPFYDSMLAKVICWGADRTQALARARQALAELEIDGVSSTAGLHVTLLEDEEFRASAVDTRWLERRRLTP